MHYVGSKLLRTIAFRITFNMVCEHCDRSIAVIMMTKKEIQFDMKPGLVPGFNINTISATKLTP